MLGLLILPSLFSSTIIHTNNAAYMESQWGGHYSLGSKTIRNRIKRTQLAGVQLPYIHADCGGIDIFRGALGFVSSQQIVDMAKSIGSAAVPFAFYLATETISPQIATGLKFFQNMAQLMNNASISSCEGAAALIGSVVPRQSKLANHTCRLMASHKGHVTDFVSGLKECSEGGNSRGRVRQDMESHPDILHEAFNVAWTVFDKSKVWKGDPSTKELLMSMTGTIIADGKGGFQVYPSLIFDEEFFNAFAKGGTTKIYKCSSDSQRCKTIQGGQRTLTDTDTPAARIQTLIASIEDKTRSERQLTPEESELVSVSSLPLLKIINVLSVYDKKGFIDLMSYADIVAHDVLIHFIKEIIDEVRYLAQSLQKVQMDDAPLKKYINNLRQVERKLEQRTYENNQRIEQVFTIIKRTLVLEKAIFAKRLQS